MELSNGVIVFTWAKVVSTRQTLQIRIIEHSNCNCLELVIHDASVGYQYPNIFLNYAVLDRHIKEVDFLERFEEKRAQFILNKMVDRNILRHHIRVQMICEYIISLLSIEEGANGRSEAINKLVLRRDPMLYKSHELVLYQSSIGGRFIIPKDELFSVNQDVSEEVMDAALVKVMQAGVQLRVTEWMKPSKHDRAVGYVDRLARQRWRAAIKKVLLRNRVQCFRRLLESMSSYKSVCNGTGARSPTSINRAAGVLISSMDAVTVPASACRKLRRDGPIQLAPLRRGSATSLRKTSITVRRGSVQGDVHPVSVHGSTLSTTRLGVVRLPSIVK